MNFNEKIVKVIIAVVVVLGVSLWVFTTIRPRTYEGVNLEFPIAEGVVQVTNTSDALQVQLIGLSSQAFRVSSPSDDISGASVSQDSDEGRAQIIEFVLPSGMSEFTVSSSSDVRFKANTNASLNASVYPLSTEVTRFRLFGIVVLIIAALFYISQLYDHLWISAARRQGAKEDSVAQEAEQANFDRIMRNSSSKRPQ